jgi:hypothetical protein
MFPNNQPGYTGWLFGNICGSAMAKVLPSGDYANWRCPAWQRPLGYAYLAILCPFRFKTRLRGTPGARVKRLTFSP